VSGPAAAAPKVTRTSHVLSTQVTTIPNGGWLPIIEIEAQAPDKAGAEKLANAAVIGLREFLDSKAAAEAVPNADRLRVNGLGVAQAQSVTRGPRLLVSLLATIFIFASGCVAILMFAGLIRALQGGDTAALPPRELRDEFFAPVESPSNGAWPLADADAPWPEDDERVLVPPTPADEPVADDAELAEPAPEDQSPAPGSSTSWWGGGPR
jgi:hypothetical protein